MMNIANTSEISAKLLVAGNDRNQKIFVQFQTGCRVLWRNSSKHEKRLLRSGENSFLIEVVGGGGFDLPDPKLVASNT